MTQSQTDEKEPTLKNDVCNQMCYYVDTDEECSGEMPMACKIFAKASLKEQVYNFLDNCDWSSDSAQEILFKIIEAHEKADTDLKALCSRLANENVRLRKEMKELAGRLEETWVRLDQRAGRDPLQENLPARPDSPMKEAGH